MTTAQNHSSAEPHPAVNTTPWKTSAVLALACVLVVALYTSFTDLKTIGTDEGLRVGIINGGQQYLASEPSTQATWSAVLDANWPYAYQPLYFLLQNSVVRLAGSHDEALFKWVNIGFLFLSLQGLLALSRTWTLVPRLFLLGLFSLNAYLLMHVLQIREYIVGITFYIWSTWLVLRLDRRVLGRPWADAGWFAGYGVMLTLGFFTQSWVVFPAIAQGLFLVVRRAGDHARFYVNLAVSYTVVVAFAWPYLQQHRQKVDVGQWGAPDTPLGQSLADGLHLVLAGHFPGKSSAMDFVFWFWLLLVIAAAAMLLPRKTFAPRLGEETRSHARRQATLMLLCLGLSIAFQILYFFKVDTLSVWPRYFALHYFFVTWLVALAFNFFHTLASNRSLPLGWRLTGRVVVGAALIVLTASSIAQVRSYHRDPYLDTSTSRTDNWRIVAEGFARVLQPGDVALAQDHVHAWTLSFVRPPAQPMVTLRELGKITAPPREINRFVYLESISSRGARDEVARQLAGLGYPKFTEAGLPSTEPELDLPAWKVLIFEPR